MDGVIKIVGGKKLTGSVSPIPNKNALMAVLPASLLTDEALTYHNVPKTLDVEKHLTILKYLGAKVDDSNYQRITINCSKVNKYTIDLPEASQFRSSILYAGPLLARFKKAKIPLPGGCVLGARSINAHLEVFQKIGVEVKLNDDFVEFSLKSDLQDDFRLWQKEASVTASENIAMLAAASQTEIEIINFASEPHVIDLLNLLSGMGTDISGIGSNVIKIKGCKVLQGASYKPRPDHIDIAGYIAAAGLTGGRIHIKDSNLPEVVDGLISYFEPFNIEFKKDGSDLIVTGNTPLNIDVESSGFPIAGNSIPKFTAGPWPQFPVDALPLIVALATKIDGKLLVQNWMYETGLKFTEQLNTLGAKIEILDPHRILILGPANYKGGKVNTPEIIQACMAIFLAALADPVETTIYGADILKRRYPDIIEKYHSLGAKVTLVE